MLRGSAEDGLRLEGSIPPSMTPGAHVLLMRRPKGPVAVVTPWNWPYTMPAEIVAPALAVGNTVVWTPAPSTSVCSGLLAECFAEADLPPGVFNFVPGEGPVAGDAIVSHPDTVAVGFIGSTATGRKIAQRAAGKTLLLEMGGNGPLVVLDDADVGAAADAAITACFLCAGQSCTAGERLLVHEAVRKDFVAALAERALKQSQLGDPLLEATQMGPLNNEPVAAKMDAHVQDAVMRGAAVVAGGERAGGFPTDLYWPATILDGVPADAHAATEETFGPIAPIVAIASLEEAIEQTNASPYGLMAAIFTNDLRKGLRFAGEVRNGPREHQRDHELLGEPPAVRRPGGLGLGQRPGRRAALAGAAHGAPDRRHRRGLTGPVLGVRDNGCQPPGTPVGSGAMALIYLLSGA